MPRAPRNQCEGAIYHAMARGNRREPTVFDDRDRKCFVRTLGEVCHRTGGAVLAWVLPVNRYHLAIRPPEPNLVVAMSWFHHTIHMEDQYAKSTPGASRAPPFGANCSDTTGRHSRAAPERMLRS